MSNHKLLTSILLLTTSSFCPLLAAETPLPDSMLNIMHQDKYRHANWGFFVKDRETGRVLFDHNSDKLFLPASTTKLFSVAALLNALGDDFRFVTPVYAIGTDRKGRFEGNLILVGQGDLTFGGRQGDTDSIAFTNMDHSNANFVPGATLTPQDPLKALNSLAKQIYDKGLRVIDGNILIDDRLFQATEKRGITLSPILINENFIDLVINPTEPGKPATLSWRPNIEEYAVTNEIKTVAKGSPFNIQISSDEFGRNIVVRGTIPEDQKDAVRTLALKNPSDFARAAFIQALRAQGITVNIAEGKLPQLPLESEYKNLKPIAAWTSPPLFEYAKLILKVSHNVGANLVPLLLAVNNSQKTYEEGMLLLGKFVRENVKVDPNSFVFVDAAGGDENRLTPQAEVQLLEYVKKLPPDQFEHFYYALPVLGKDGSLADFGKSTNAVEKVRAKTGTGVLFNAATNQYFLTTQTLAGYIEGRNGHMLEFMVGVNNGIMPSIMDVFPIFEDLSKITAIIYDNAQ